MNHKPQLEIPPIDLPKEHLLGRRPFLQVLLHGLGVLFGLVLGIPAVAYLIDARNRKAPPGNFKKTLKHKDLPIDEPVQVVIRDVHRDAWTLHPNEVVGRVWLVRRDGDKIDAFTTICPHLGCSINFDKHSDRFICPCHNGTWDKNGKRFQTPGFINPAPRDMDLLEQHVDPSDPDMILVKYENYAPGEKDKIVKK